MRKAERHAAIRARCSRAIANMYHNATPTYPRVEPDDEDRAQAWYEFTAQYEIKYLNGGGAYAPTVAKYRAILERNARDKYTSPAARARYIARGMAQMREERAGVAAWERINEWGTLYQWGRGGRTLAPADMVRECGGSSFALKVHEYDDGYSIADVVDAIRVFESFNTYVKSWCRGVPDMWEESERDRKAQEEEEAAEAEEAQQRECERRERELDQHYTGL